MVSNQHNTYIKEPKRDQAANARIVSTNFSNIRLNHSLTISILRNPRLFFQDVTKK